MYTRFSEASAMSGLGSPDLDVRVNLLEGVLMLPGKIISPNACATLEMEDEFI
jgi:hypothetical protein